MPIYKPSEIHQLGIRAKKRLSQNFLIDQNILEKFCAAADIKAGDQVLEIGSGPGALTEKLLEKGAQVLAIEKDPLLAEKLKQVEGEKLQIHCEDALTFSLENISHGTKIVANLPFNISTPLIVRFIRKFPMIISLTVMVQREVGLRMTAEKNSPLYNSFTLFLKAYSKPHYCFTVKPSSLFPSPSVQSCVIHMPLHPFPFSYPEESFFTLIRTSFGKRRKMLRASLRELYPQERVGDVLKKIGLNSTARPQELSLDDFSKLFKELEGTKNSYNT